MSRFKFTVVRDSMSLPVWIGRAEPDRRLLSPGSEWRLHRHWLERSALKDLHGADERLGDSHKLYA